MEPAVSDFIKTSVWHGTLDASAAILAAHPEITAANIHIAAILGDDEGVRHFIPFMRVNSMCGHRVRPPVGRMERCSGVAKPFAT